MPLRPRLSDRARLLCVALATAAAILVGGAVLPPKYTTWMGSKWLRFGLVSAGLAFLELKAYWRVRKSLEFWAVFFAFFAAYLACVGYFFYKGEGISTLAFVLAGVGDFMGMGLVIYWILGVGPDRMNLNL